MDSMCLPQALNSYVEILTPYGMVLGGGAFGRWLGQESKALMNGISALAKETPERSLTLSAMWRYNEKMAAWKLEEGLTGTQLC